MASSWLTMCAARWLDRAIWRSECFIVAGSPRPLSISRAASSACVRKPASGVFSWCAASARKCRCVAIGAVQPLQQVVDGAHQRHHLVGHVAFGNRAQVGALALADAQLQPRQRADAARQREPHQHHRQRQDHELRQDHALDDLGGQRRALAQRLGHLHQRLAVVALAGARRSHSQATRTGSSPIWSSRKRTAARRARRHRQGTASAASPASSSPRRPSTWK